MGYSFGGCVRVRVRCIRGCSTVSRPGTTFTSSCFCLLEYVVPSDDNLEPAEAQLLPAFVSLIVFLPDYSADSEPMDEDPDEDPKEDLEEEPSGEEEEEEEPLAMAASA
ncbi:hypothetical protein Tco_1034635 [Tanacetum coccineum]